MPNLSITRRCKRNCSYCFAMHERERVKVLDMPRDVYEKSLVFLQRSKISDVRLLGGEPTEHPFFDKYVTLALDRGFTVTVFTGGLIPDTSIDFLYPLPLGRIMVVLNAANPGTDHTEWIEAQERACDTLGEKVQLGITLQSSSNGHDYLLNWIGRYNLSRHLRIGVAHPIMGGKNKSMRLQANRILNTNLEAFCGRAEKAGVEISFDCGVTPCMFSSRFMEEHEALVQSLGSRCNSIIDILPEGEVIACYALSRLRHIPLTDQSTRHDLISMFDNELEDMLPAGIFRDCAFCEHRSKGHCGGGCRARRALRLRPDVLRLLNDDR